MEVYVAIVDRETGEPSRVMGPMNWRAADRVERGASINLDHDNWKVVQKTESSLPEGWKEKAE